MKRAPTAVPEIREAESAGELETVRRLFLEYQQAIGVDLCFQGFARELASLPGDYSRPGGRLFLAAGGEEILGCVAVRPLLERDCEMKRLYVRPVARGLGVGRLLTTAVLEAARAIGYRRIVLDTLPSMKEALALYRSLGFRDTAPYYANPLPGATYLALEL